MLEAAFTDLTAKYAVAKLKKFKQSSYIPLFYGKSPLAGSDISEGMCRALSAAFIVRSWTKELDDVDFLTDYYPRVSPAIYRQIAGFAASVPKSGFNAPAISGKFTASFNDQQVRDAADLARFTALATIQKQSFGNNAVHDAKMAVAELSNNTMPFAEQVICCPSRIRKRSLAQAAEEIAFGVTEEDALGKDIALSPRTPPGYLTKTGFWLISLTGHMVAAVVKPQSKRFRFFDPNNGIAQWTDPAPFDRFMNSFTGHEQVTGLFAVKWLRFG